MRTYTLRIFPQVRFAGRFIENSATAVTAKGERDARKYSAAC
jgi:hypothetical protein